MHSCRDYQQTELQAGLVAGYSKVSTAEPDQPVLGSGGGGRESGSGARSGPEKYVFDEDQRRPKNGPDSGKMAKCRRHEFFFFEIILIIFKRPQKMKEHH